MAGELRECGWADEVKQLFDNFSIHHSTDSTKFTGVHGSITIMATQPKELLIDCGVDELIVTMFEENQVIFSNVIKCSDFVTGIKKAIDGWKIPA